MRAALGEAYLQPQRPMGMGGTLTKLAAMCVMGFVESDIGVAADPHQIAVNAKGGCDMVQWVLKIIMELIHIWRGRHLTPSTRLAIWSAHVSVQLYWPTS